MLTEGLVLKRQEKLWSFESFDSYPQAFLHLWSYAYY